MVCSRKNFTFTFLKDASVHDIGQSSTACGCLTEVRRSEDSCKGDPPGEDESSCGVILWIGNYPEDGVNTFHRYSSNKAIKTEEKMFTSG